MFMHSKFPLLSGSNDNLFPLIATYSVDEF